jgi:hypothetical protein
VTQLGKNLNGCFYGYKISKGSINSNFTAVGFFSDITIMSMYIAPEFSVIVVYQKTKKGLLGIKCLFPSSLPALVLYGM